MRIELRAFSRHRDVGIAQAIALCRDQRHGLPKQNLRIDVLVFARRIGEMIPDVAHIRRAQQRIAQRMDQHVGIRMAQQAQRMLNLDTSEPQLASLDQTMHVVAESHSYLCHSYNFLNRAQR